LAIGEKLVKKSQKIQIGEKITKNENFRIDQI